MEANQDRRRNSLAPIISDSGPRRKQKTSNRAPVGRYSLKLHRFQALDITLAHGNNMSRGPQEIMDQITARDAESAVVPQRIWGLR